MQISVSSTLTLVHDGQFWVAVVEHVEDEKFGAARIVFGAEPSDEELLHFVVDRWEKLAFFGNSEHKLSKLAKNPKRRVHEAAKALKKPATSTKAQQILSEQREVLKEESVHSRSQKRQERKQERFEARAAKRKQKHRGH